MSTHSAARKLLGAAICAAVFAAPVAWAEIYVWTDSEGVEHMSNQMPPAEQIPPESVQTLRPSRINAPESPAVVGKVPGPEEGQIGEEDAKAPSSEPEAEAAEQAETPAAAEEEPEEPGAEEAAEAETTEPGVKQAAPATTREKLYQIRKDRREAVRRRLQGRPVKPKQEEAPETVEQPSEPQQEQPEEDPWWEL
jgi:hypothetical protein